MADASVLIPPQGDDFLALGQNSYLKPQKLQAGQYVEGMNIMCRGGSPQTRPGSRTVFTVPDGNFQGVTFFSPANGVGHIVFAVDGRVYAASHPFTACVRLPGIQFSVDAPQIAWASCLKSTFYDSNGELQSHDTPYSVLMMQDGRTRAAYWDGTVSGHIDPTQSDNFAEDGSRITIDGRDGTPVGLWMVWSNNRLWVSRGNQVFASDIGNPLKFTEAQYINEARAFYLPCPCTGMVETSDQQGIICFTETTGTFLTTSIQDRLKWLDTPEFQKTVLPTIGCVAPRSIVQQYGMVWWYSAKGLISLNDALRQNFTSRLDIQDNEMFSTKFNVSYDLSRICGHSYENLLLMSVPYGDALNTRTMVLDQAPFNENVNAWASHWTGWRPIEWAKGLINSEERIFFGSVDYDGKNRIWEAMTPDKTDNGTPITCYVMTREHLFDSRDYKVFNYAEIEVEGLYGNCAVMVAAAGVRGAFQKIGTFDLVATKGTVYGDKNYGVSHRFGGSRPQTRLIKTQDRVPASECNEACVEGDVAPMKDKAFSLLIAWSGVMAVNSYRIFVQSTDQTYQGACETDEEGPRLLTEEGCGALAYFTDLKPFEEYESTKTFSKVNPETAILNTYTWTAESKISQKDADRKAETAAEVYVLTQLGEA